jgi:PAS domain S-box-containing protein
MDTTITTDTVHSLESMVASLTELLTVQETVVSEQSEKIRQNESRFRAIFEGSNDAIMLLTEKGYLDCNPSALKIFGIATKEEFMKSHPAKLSPPMQPDGQASEEAAGERIRTAFETGMNRFEWAHRRADGTVFPTEVLLSAFDWGQDRVLQATVRDISERKQSEKALEESNERFLGFIREAAMRLKTPLEVVEENIGGIVCDVEKGGYDPADIILQLKIQMKNMEQIRLNIIELNRAITEHSDELPVATRKFLLE